jgi:PiT family inorganic phosphate transporter
MSTVATAPAGTSLLDQKMKKGPGLVGVLIFAAVILGGLAYCGFNIVSDMGNVAVVSIWPYVLLAVALLIALGFEFVNGFHDTANAVATVIYTHTLEPHVAVVWSGCWNLIGVLTSSGAVAFAVITLLPVELILQVSSGAGFAMVFALLIAAIIWNLSTWALGLPASSSHTMVGSIIGVGIANQLMQGNNGTAGVDWDRSRRSSGAADLAAGRLWRGLAADAADQEAGQVSGAVSGSQGRRAAAVPDSRSAGAHLHRRQLWPWLERRTEGHGPDHAHPDRHGADGLRAQPRGWRLAGGRFCRQFRPGIRHPDSHVDKNAIMTDPRSDVTDFIKTKKFTPTTMVALRELVEDVSHEVGLYKELKAVPPKDQQNVRNDMYVASAALNIKKQEHKDKNEPTVFTDQEDKVLTNYQKQAGQATKFIPLWVKVAVALALGMGTMVGWKRIVVTVGEKIGKDHLTYAQGASAELVAMARSSRRTTLACR